MRSLLASLFIVILCVATAMPGKHSPDKLALRRDRARVRGFLAPIARVDGVTRTRITVDSGVAERAKSAVRSLELHARHNGIAKKPHLFVAHATLAARAVIGEAEFKKGIAVHKKRNRALHEWNWADLNDDSEDDVSTCDPLQLNGPWAKALNAKDASTSQPLCCDSKPRSLSADAPVFSPAMGCAADPVSEGDHQMFCDVEDYHNCAAQNLIDALNSTISMQEGELQRWRTGVLRFVDPALPDPMHAVVSGLHDEVKHLFTLVNDEHVANTTLISDVSAATEKRVLEVQKVTIEAVVSKLQIIVPKVVDLHLEEKVEALRREFNTQPAYVAPCGASDVETLSVMTDRAEGKSAADSQSLGNLSPWLNDADAANSKSYSEPSCVAQTFSVNTDRSQEDSAVAVNSVAPAYLSPAPSHDAIEALRSDFRRDVEILRDEFYNAQNVTMDILTESYKKAAILASDRIRLIESQLEKVKIVDHACPVVVNHDLLRNCKLKIYNFTRPLPQPHKATLKRFKDDRSWQHGGTASCPQPCVETKRKKTVSFEADNVAGAGEGDLEGGVTGSAPSGEVPLVGAGSGGVCGCDLEGGVTGSAPFGERTPAAPSMPIPKQQ